jgi:hypothetical protein
VSAVRFGKTVVKEMGSVTKTAVKEMGSVKKTGIVIKAVEAYSPVKVLETIIGAVKS